MKKIRPIKNTWYDWLNNHIPEPIIQTHLSKPYMVEERK